MAKWCLCDRIYQNTMGGPSDALGKYAVLLPARWSMERQPFVWENLLGAIYEKELSVERPMHGLWNFMGCVAGRSPKRPFNLGKASMRRSTLGQESTKWRPMAECASWPTCTQAIGHSNDRTNTYRENAEKTRYFTPASFGIGIRRRVEKGSFWCAESSDINDDTNCKNNTTSSPQYSHSTYGSEQHCLRFDFLAGRKLFGLLSPCNFLERWEHGSML